MLALQTEVAAALALVGASAVAQVEPDLLEVGLDDGQGGARAGRDGGADLPAALELMRFVNFVKF